MQATTLFVITCAFMAALGWRASCEASWRDAQLRAGEELCRPGHAMGLVTAEGVGTFVACVYDSAYKHLELKPLGGYR
jgi:hypothetical protein